MDLTNVKATAYTIVLGLAAFLGVKLLGADWTIACTGAIGVLGAAVVKHYFHITLPSSATVSDTTALPGGSVTPAPSLTIHAQNVHLSGADVTDATAVPEAKESTGQTAAVAAA